MLRTWARGAVLLAVAVSGAACSSGHTPTVREAAPTPIARVNTDVMSIPRIDFCPLVPKVAITDALRVKRWTAHDYGNGDQAPLGSGSDVVAEHLCTWQDGNDGTVARAWVFARPVGSGLARSVVRRTKAEPGCQVSVSPRFGNPTVTQVCTPPGRLRVRHAGLFTDTWLSCELEAAAGDPALDVLRRRADAWCVEVANALNTAR